MTPPVRVLLADDQALLRVSLATVLGADERIEVVGTVADGRAAVTAVQQRSVDVVLMDIRMPVLDGIAATAQVVRLSPRTRVLALTTFDLDELVLAALRAGASGYLTKDARPAVLIDAICDVAAGNSALAPAAAASLVEHVRRTAEPRPQAVAQLSPREREVFDLIAAGRSNGEIGAQLHLTQNTVKTHVRAVLTKLDLRDRVHVVIFAYENGLAGPPHPAG
ncbi:response regulator transcription factor [Micromonospora carbonacea]|uniref:Response regulator transcription factor n=1 Tax=Micromonospora carbonacea TaxID=47853 RepID=A0A7H8XSM2_9ACTN|nr:response regulator transcription factor [Micromonospora carbonacea]MBB5830071.1 DNA-binding NarL/FixJ family response regulator [Micromonospora carbonacea]QLD28006.1 response regulator transcription factor [Micromonospora carbonacea]